MASRALSIRNRLDNALKKFGPGDRIVYKRAVTTGSGDALIGRATSSTVDTILSPQPTYTRLARYDVGPGSRSEMLAQGSKQEVANMYAFICSPTAMSLAELDGGLTYLVLVDASSNKEIFEITDYDPVAMGGVDIMFMVYAKSISRP
jgi:hypothetical protein